MHTLTYKTHPYKRLVDHISYKTNKIMPLFHQTQLLKVINSQNHIKQISSVLNEQASDSLYPAIRLLA